jgi:hypothetical protein
MKRVELGITSSFLSSGLNEADEIWYNAGIPTVHAWVAAVWKDIVPILGLIFWLVARSVKGRHWMGFPLSLLSPLGALAY